MQASDRLYYLYQTLADTQEALAASPEGQAALQQAAQQQLSQWQQAGASGSSDGGSSSGGAKSKGKAAAAAAVAAGPAGEDGAALLAEVLGALSDDLNTPLAVAAFSAPLKAMNDLLHTKKVRARCMHCVLCALCALCPVCFAVHGRLWAGRGRRAG